MPYPLYTSNDFLPASNQANGSPGTAKVPRHDRLRIELSANGTLALPAGYAARRIYFWNKTANAVTGGIRIGNVTTGTQYVTAQAIAASTQAEIVPTISGWSLAQPQVASTLFIEAVTAWNNATVVVLVDCDILVQNAEAV
jgi:hypothetical protein